MQNPIRTRIASTVISFFTWAMIAALAAAQTNNTPSSKQLIDLAVARVTMDNDAPLTRQIASILSKYGIPTVSQVGDEASYAFVVATIYPDRTGFEHRVWKDVVAHKDKYPEDALRFYRARMKIVEASERTKRYGVTNPVLQKEIEKMIAEDQAVRSSMTAIIKDGGNAMHRVDEGHAAALEQILKTYGVPTFTMVGPSAASDFTIMIQHQSAAMRDEALPLVKSNFEKGEDDGHDLALMTDRSLNDHGKPQYYGTQVDCIDGKGVLKPVESTVGLDLRRADLGVIRTALYVQIANQFCQR